MARTTQDKKKHIDLYVGETKVEALGIEKIKEVSYSAIDKEFKKSKILFMQKMYHKKMFEFFKEKYGAAEAAQLVQLSIVGKTFYRCLALSEERHGVDAWPDTCLTILEEVYGKRLNKMKPKTIVDKITAMMLQAMENPHNESIIEVVNNWING